MFLHVLAFSFISFHFLSFSDIFLHVLSFSVIVFHFIFFHFTFLHFLSCSFIFYHLLSCSFIFFHFLSLFSFVFFHFLACYSSYVKNQFLDPSRGVPLLALSFFSVGYHLVFSEDQVESRKWWAAGGSSPTFVPESPGWCPR